MLRLAAYTCRVHQVVHDLESRLGRGGDFFLKAKGSQIMVVEKGEPWTFGRRVVEIVHFAVVLDILWDCMFTIFRRTLFARNISFATTGSR